MSKIVKNFKSYPAMTAAIAGAVVWGLVEFVALQRTQGARDNTQA